MLNNLRDEAYKTSIKHGFWKERKKAGVYGEVTALALVISEVCEAIERLRRGRNNVDEIADSIIRLLDYCGFKQYDIDTAVTKKMAKNKRRPYLHRRRF